MSKYLIFLLFLIPFRAFTLEVMATHPMICQDLRSIGVLGCEAVDLGGQDPHHFTPGPRDIKKFYQAKNVVRAPRALQPWVRKLKDSKSELLKGQKLDHSTSHYWLYPTLHCRAINELAVRFNRPFDKKKCLKKKLKVVERIVEGFQRRHKSPIILSHDALLPLLASHQLYVIALKGSEHHGSMKAKQLKRVIKTLKSSPKVIWIQESDISLPPRIEKMKRGNDIIIKWNPMKVIEGLDPLEQLAKMVTSL